MRRVLSVHRLPKAIRDLIRKRSRKVRVTRYEVKGKRLGARR